jgi:hypothetical protein
VKNNNNRTTTTAAIPIVALVLSIISGVWLLMIVSAPVFADEYSITEIKIQQEHKQEINCDTKIKVDDDSTLTGGGASSSGTSAANRDLASTAAAAAPGMGTTCESNADSNVSIR